MEYLSGCGLDAMKRSAVVDSPTEFGPIPGAGDRSRWRVVSAVGWAAAAVAVAAAASAAGVALGRQLPPFQWPVITFNGSATQTAGLMAGLVGLTGLLAGGVAGLVLGGAERNVAAVRHGLGWAAIGALAGGLGPILEAVSGGRLPAAAAMIVACGIAGLLAALVGYTCRRRPPEPARALVDDWRTDTDLPDRPPAPTIARTADAGPVMRQWPILLVSAACLLVIMVGPASPAGWPLLAVALLGFATAWALASQERRLRALEDRLPKRADDAELHGRDRS
jgi:hypothetical protein